MSRHRLTALAAAAALLAGGLSGCDNGAAEPKPEATSSAPASESTTPAPPTEAEQAKAALEKYLEVRDTAYTTVELDIPALRKVATGKEFFHVQEVVLTDKGLKVTTEGEIGHEVEEPRRRGNSYLIRDCEDVSGFTRYKDGTDPIPQGIERVSGERQTRNVFEYTVVRHQGRWKVSDYNLPKGATC